MTTSGFSENVRWCYVWTEEYREYFQKVIKEKRYTTNFDSKTLYIFPPTRFLRELQLMHFTMDTSANHYCTIIIVLFYNFIFYSVEKLIIETCGRRTNSPFDWLQSAGGIITPRSRSGLVCPALL